MQLHVYGCRAYRSPFCLYRAHRVPVEESETVEATDGVRCLFRVEFEEGPPRFFESGADARAAFQQAFEAFQHGRGWRLIDVTVM